MMDKMATARIRAIFSDITCGEACWHAKEDVCRCECGGKNHGIQLRGGSGVRACRIQSKRYELLAVGKYSDLLQQVEALCMEEDVANGKREMRNGKWWCKGYTGRWFQGGYVHPSEYNGGGTYVLRRATMPQCIKWHELEYMQIATERERYDKTPAILWKRADLILEDK